jgi:hypothetical protein
VTDNVALVAALEDLGRELRAAPVVDLAPDVLERLTVTRREPRAVEPRAVERRRVALAAAAVVMVVVTLVTAVRPTREAIADFLGIGDTEIRTVPELDIPHDVELDLGEPIDLDDVAERAGFQPLVPSALGNPEAAYFRTVAGMPQVSLVWPPDAGAGTLPAVTSAGTLLTETPLGGRELPGYTKEIGPSARVERILLGGREAFWIEGEHVRFGVDEPRRAAASTLLWTSDGLMLRLETTRGLDGALEIARSVTPPG